MKSGSRIEHALWNVGRELDVAGGQYVARHGDHRSARGDPARRRLYADVAVAPDDAIGRCRQRQRHLLAELCDQRAQSLTAADRGVAILRTGLVADGDILQVLARETGAEHKLRRVRPNAEVLRQHRCT